jgi:hypothetical protein
MRRRYATWNKPNATLRLPHRYIRTIDYVYAMIMFVAYVWASTIIIFREKNEKAMWVAVIVGSVFMITALGLSFVVVRRTRHHFVATKAESEMDVREKMEVRSAASLSRRDLRTVLYRKQV